MNKLRPSAALPSVSLLRTCFQAAFLVYTLWMGYRFYRFYLWAVGQSLDFVPRPAGVEGFLPISALLSAKRFFMTGRFDPIHPAGLTIFLAALTIALLLRKGFCGWICPVGGLSNLCERLLRGISVKRFSAFPAWLDRPLLSLKYLLLAFFLYIIVWKMDLRSVTAFQHSFYNLAVDARMLLFFLNPTALAGVITLAVVVLSLLFRNFWCRYLCPYGALLGLLALASPFQVRRNVDKCIDCHRCDEVCPAALTVSGKQTVRACECVGCMDCVAACPGEDCLTVQAPGGKRVSTHLVPAAVVLTFLAFFALALATGHWHSKVPAETLRRVYTINARSGR